MSIPIIDLNVPSTANADLNSATQGLMSFFQKREDDKKHRESGRSLGEALGLPEDQITALENQSAQDRQLTIQGMQIRERNIQAQRKAIDTKFTTAIRGLDKTLPGDREEIEKHRKTWVADIASFDARQDSIYSKAKKAPTIKEGVKISGDGDPEINALSDKFDEPVKPGIVKPADTEIGQIGQSVVSDRFLKSPKPDAAIENAKRVASVKTQGTNGLRSLIRGVDTPKDRLDLDARLTDVSDYVSGIEKKLSNSGYSKKKRDEILSDIIEKAEIPILDIAERLNADPEDVDAIRDLKRMFFEANQTFPSHASLDLQEDADDFVESFIRDQAPILSKFRKKPLLKRIFKDKKPTKASLRAPTKGEMATNKAINDILKIIA
jgi:hypothetical protein